VPKHVSLDNTYDTTGGCASMVQKVLRVLRKRKYLLLQAAASATQPRSDAERERERERERAMNSFPRTHAAV
jgi:hypothetical protein